MINPVLVEIFRGEVLESFHRGVICVVDEHNQVIGSAGDIQQLCYPRSALKFFQQIPLIKSGAVEKFGFTQQEIAILCGSHNGEKEHVKTVQSILSKIGLDETYLKCGAQMPTLREDQHELIRNGKKASAIQNNCSGKHAGFLAYCVYYKLPLDNYIDPKHPLHQEILKVIADFYQYPIEKIQCGVDGCSAPIFAFPVVNQAIAYKNLIHPSMFDLETQKACKILTDAVIAFPAMIAGSKRYCTDLMQVADGKLVGKTGADGVFSIGVFGEKWGICIKVDDGKMGPQYNIAQAVLEKLNLLSEVAKQKLHVYLEFENKNFGGLVTGKTVAKMVDFL